MNALDLFLRRFREFSGQPAFVWRDQNFTYQELLRRMADIEEIFRQQAIPERAVIALATSDSPYAYAALFAILQNKGIAVMGSHYQDVAQAEFVLVGDHENIEIVPTGRKALHPLYENVNQGLVLFSSGTSAEPKAVLHDFQKLAERFAERKNPRRMLQALRFDHIGGLNTALSSLAHGGCLILLEQKDPASVMNAVEKHNVEILPTSPSFLQWLLLAKACENRKFSALKIITYGTEPMPLATLKNLRRVLPNVSFKQTYGLSELGILGTKSKSDDSLWLKIRSDTRIRDGLLEIKTPTSMVGYLNAKSPITSDGWFQTFDAVEVDGEWIKILGRQNELINVGGLKVSPVEVENVLLEMPNVLDVTVRGEANPLLGSVVKAQFHLSQLEPISDFRTRMRLFCQGRLEPCKIPQDVEILGYPPDMQLLKKQRMSGI